MENNTGRLLEKITGFLVQIGIGFSMCTIKDETFMPGVGLENGIILIDTEKLLYPGDILHEAGHLAVLSADERVTSTGKLSGEFSQLGNEIMAQAWSYAACVAIGLDPLIVFHEHGYRGAGKALIETFSSGNPVGVPALQWLGMTYDKANAGKLNTLAYPNMICWVRQA